MAPVKPRTSQKERPHPSRYQHSDPLLRRLRLIDGHGDPVDLKSAFRDTKLVVFYFGSQWNASEAKGCQKLVSRLCRNYPHELKAVRGRYPEQGPWCMTDVQPWLAMEWDDGSTVDLAKLSDTTDMDELDQDRPEPYLLAGDEDPDQATVERDDRGTSYVLPFSRVYMADLFDIVMTPHLAVYHLPTRTFLDKHVRLSRISSSRYEATMETWLQGEPSPSFNVWDMVSIAPWSFVMVFLALAYFLLVYLGGEQYHIQHIMARFS